MTISLSRQQVERAFEDNKDDPRVQAMLKLLGNKREQVVGWEITPHPHDKHYATFSVDLDDERMIRGYISFVPQHNDWKAGGNILPAFQAKRIREAQ